jgi:division protein CdvB (Snf7/Vps24/ESCRT-III family)
MAPSLGVFSSDDSNKNLKDKINLSLKHIETQRKELEQLRIRLEDRRKSMFDQTVGAIEKNDEMRARVLAGEHIELQKITKVVNASELALLHISVRLETIRDVGDVMFVLNNAFKTVKRVGKSVTDAAPNLEQVAAEINDSLGNILAELGMISPNVNISLADTPTEIFQKAQKLIDERTTELADLPHSILQRIERNTEEESLLEQTKKIAMLATEGDDDGDDDKSAEFRPVLLSGSSSSRKSIDTDVINMGPQIESPPDPEFAVRSYIKQLGSFKIDVLDASAQLNLPVDLVEQAYIKVLAEKRFPSNFSSSERRFAK